jgi:hypothetical protein
MIYPIASPRRHAKVEESRDYGVKILEPPQAEAFVLINAASMMASLINKSERGGEAKRRTLHVQWLPFASLYVMIYAVTDKRGRDQVCGTGASQVS